MNYLKRHRIYEDMPKMEFTSVEITDDSVSILSEGRIHCSITRKETYTLKMYEDYISDIKELGKRKEVKLEGINKATKRVQEDYNEYLKAMNDYNKDFDLFVVLWEQSIDNLKYDFEENDLVYTEVIMPLYSKLKSYSNYNTISFDFDHIRTRLLLSKEELMNDSECTKVMCY